MDPPGGPPAAPPGSSVCAGPDGTSSLETHGSGSSSCNDSVLSIHGVPTCALETQPQESTNLAAANYASVKAVRSQSCLAHPWLRVVRRSAPLHKVMTYLRLHMPAGKVASPGTLEGCVRYASRGVSLVAVLCTTCRAGRAIRGQRVWPRSSINLLVAIRALPLQVQAAPSSAAPDMGACDTSCGAHAALSCCGAAAVLPAGASSERAQGQGGSVIADASQAPVDTVGLHWCVECVLNGGRGVAAERGRLCTG